ncbi:hypothetical protein [Paraburkholderia fungorum]|uniref:hypothetical protein n=1 Tax=Paraburkholderia fungorum TaxID=134537 RepID=UPI000FD83F91|nr:hypothetical protein [Paraburkholderia fungorum]MBB5546637.1 hypothetical protein [Paraburkholderia fungorum]
MQSNESTFYIDVRDGTVEQHRTNVDVVTFPPSTGKSVSGLMTALHDDGSQHRAILGSTRAGMSAFLTRDSGGARRANEKCSRLLASLLARQ